MPGVKGPSNNKSVKRGRRGAAPARRIDEGILWYFKKMQRSWRGWIGGRSHRLVVGRTLADAALAEDPKALKRVAVHLRGRVDALAERIRGVLS